MDEIRPEVHNDRRLVDAALRGEPIAIEQLAHRLRCVPRVLSAWNARMGRPLDEHDVADLAQDVTVIILEKLDDYAGRAPFEAWVYRICRLELMNGIRSKSRRRAAGALEFDDSLVAGPPADGFAAAEFEALYAALERVGGVEAEVIRIKHFDGLTFEEIGLRLGMSPNTAKTRYYRGMMRMEALLRDGRAREEKGRTG